MKNPHNENCEDFNVGLPGFEPGQTEPKPVVLPLHHSPIIIVLSLKSDAKVVLFLFSSKLFVEFFFILCDFPYLCQY